MENSTEPWFGNGIGRATLLEYAVGIHESIYNCVYQQENEKGLVGVSLARKLMVVAGDAMKNNITTPALQFKFLVTLVKRKFLAMKVKPYILDFKLAFEHFCIHAGGRAILDEQ
ncbi:hypothetical protein AAC387_Pa05g1539 [Persea americana]